MMTMLYNSEDFFFLLFSCGCVQNIKIKINKNGPKKLPYAQEQWILHWHRPPSEVDLISIESKLLVAKKEEQCCCCTRFEHSSTLFMTHETLSHKLGFLWDFQDQHEMRKAPWFICGLHNIIMTSIIQGRDLRSQSLGFCKCITVCLQKTGQTFPTNYFSLDRWKHHKKHACCVFRWSCR